MKIVAASPTQASKIHCQCFERAKSFTINKKKLRRYTNTHTMKSLIETENKRWCRHLSRLSHAFWYDEWICRGEWQKQSIVVIRDRTIRRMQPTKYIFETGCIYVFEILTTKNISREIIHRQYHLFDGLVLT